MCLKLEQGGVRFDTRIMFVIVRVLKPRSSSSTTRTASYRWSQTPRPGSERIHRQVFNPDPTPYLAYLDTPNPPPDDQGHGFHFLSPPSHRLRNDASPGQLRTISPLLSSALLCSALLSSALLCSALLTFSSSVLLRSLVLPRDQDHARIRLHPVGPIPEGPTPAHREVPRTR